MKHTRLSTNLIWAWFGVVMTTLILEFIPALTLLLRRIDWMQEAAKQAAASKTEMQQVIYVPLVALCIFIVIQVLCCLWILWQLHKTYTDEQHHISTPVLVGTLFVAILLVTPYSFICMPLAKITSSTDARAMVYWAEGLRLPMHALLAILHIADHVNYSNWREEYPKETRSFIEFLNIEWPKS